MRLRLYVMASLLAGAGCGDEGGFPDAGVTPVIATGNVALTWSLTDLAGQPITCAQIGGTTVSMTLHSLDKIYGSADSFSCGNSPSVSAQADVGRYRVSAVLQGTNLVPVAGPEQTDVVITANQTTQLTPVTFQVDASGTLALKLAVPPLASACGAAPDGANINVHTLTLQHSDGSCEPATFVRTKGGANVGSYTVNCTSPVATPCIEADETLTATGLPSGPYTVHVRGLVGANTCWLNDDGLSVPAQSQLLSRTLNLAKQPGC